MMLFLAGGIENEHYWVVEEIEGLLVETPWRVERESDGYRLSHADDSWKTALVFTLGWFGTPEAAVQALGEVL
jgi:hypothetical protein